MKPKILIIEDDPSILSQLTHLLTANGYEAAGVTELWNKPDHLPQT